jgi:transposase
MLGLFIPFTRSLQAMPAERISMRKLLDILRLRFEARLSFPQIAKALNVSAGSAHSICKRAESLGITWPLPDGLTQEQLEVLLYSQPSDDSFRFIPPDFTYIHQELKRKGVTLQLLWEEYAQNHPDNAYQYSRFCDLYRDGRASTKLVMRQQHKAGEKMFVDYAGQTVPIHDPSTGTVHQAQIFLAVLGASNFSYAEATYTQSLPDWISSHVRAFSFFGGVPNIITPDNLKSGVTHACFYEPELNPTYADMAAHYGVAILPARPRKSRDKSKVEVGVQIVERWVLARLRKLTFFSLAELNQQIRTLMDKLNSHPFKKIQGCRLSLFEAVEKPVLKPLPSTHYEYCEWLNKRVGQDYHIEVDNHFYSAPYTLARQKIEVRLTAATVELFYKGKRVASHVRSYTPSGQTTLLCHMPKAHQKYKEWTPDAIKKWGADNGAYLLAVVTHLFETKPHPEMGYRSCLGLIKLSKQYGIPRLDHACQIAINNGSPSFNSIQSILKKGIDLLSIEDKGNQDGSLPLHENVRGASYYTTNIKEESTYVN